MAEAVLQVEDLAARAVSLLDRWMARRQNDDDLPDFHHTGEIANALSVNKGTARRVLDELFAQGRVRRLDFSNGIAWRSVNPLPYEPGGSIDLARRKREEHRPFSTPAPTFILQREVRDGRHSRWFDDGRFPNEERARSALETARSTAEARARGWDVQEPVPQFRIVVEVA